MHARIFCERPFVLSVLCMCFGAVVPTTPVVVTASACSTAVGRGLASRTMVMMVWLHSGQQYPSSWGMVTASASSSTTVGVWRPACGRCNVVCLYFWAAVPVAYAVVTASACSAIVLVVVWRPHLCYRLHVFAFYVVVLLCFCFGFQNLTKCICFVSDLEVYVCAYLCERRVCIALCSARQIQRLDDCLCLSAFLLEGSGFHVA